MALRVKKHRRNPILAAIALPILASMWIVGWCLFWIGSQNTTRSTTDRSDVQIAVIAPEEHELIGK